MSNRRKSKRIENYREQFAEAREVFEQYIANRQAIELIRSPNKWPVYPFLCLRHRRETDGTLRVTGLMYAPLHKDYAVFSPTNLYDIPAFGGQMTQDEFMARRHDYESVEHLLEDWEID